MCVGIRRPVVAGLVSLCALVGGSAFASASALAAAPEEPLTLSPAQSVTATSAVLEGVLNPQATVAGEGGSYAFLYRPSGATPAECAGGEVSPGGVSAGLPAERVTPEAVGGLLPNTEYTFCLQAKNAAEETTTGAPVTFTTRSAPPMVEGETVVSLKSTTATLSAQINPQGLITTYEFEYSSDGVHWSKAPEPAGSVSGQGNKTASVEVAGLTAETKYEFRVVAMNSVGESGEGAVETFTTAPAGLPGLPDNRTYEMVTPVENYDADVYVPFALPEHFVNNGGEFITHLPFEVAANGEAVAYVASPTVGGTGSRAGNEYLSRRSASGDWGKPVGLQPVGENNTAVDSAFYQAFSPDLSLGILESGTPEAPDTPSLSMQAPGEGYSVLYARALSEEGESYQPFFTSRPSNRTPLEFEAYGIPRIYTKATAELAYAGASADLSRLLFEANGAFAGTGADESSGANENNLYESVNGRLSLVNVLPDESTEANATFGAPPFNNPNKNLPDLNNVISEDGSRIFWTALEDEVTPRALYVSEGVGSPGERTVQVDASQVPGGKGGGGRFWTASKNGSRVFFTDSEAAELTGNTHAGSGENLYVYEVNPVDGEPGRLTDLTPATEVGVEGVLGEGEAASGRYTIYFVARGALASNENSNGVKADSGADNLYMLQEGAQPTFVAALSSEDGKKSIKPLANKVGEIGDWATGLGHRTAEVTPDGESVVFMSNDQEFEGHYEEAFGQHLEEVYVFDREDGTDGSLFCASCARDGLKAQENLESERDLGAFLPVSNALTYQPTLISEDGSQVFLDADEPLVSADTNGEQDVYEWERDKSGGCQQSNGCVSLLSGGIGYTSSWLIGADATGNNVFFITRARLVSGEGNDEAYNIFDASADGTQPVPPPSCTGTGCQGVPSVPPTFATPPSGTYEGVGDFPPPAPAKPSGDTKVKPLTRAQKLARALKACKKDKSRKQQAKCMAQAHKKYGSTSKAKSRKGGK